LVYGDLLIIASQAPEAGVVAYDKRTCELKWKTPTIRAVGYVSPAIVKIDGEDQIVMVSASERSGSGRFGGQGGPPPGAPPQGVPGQGSTGGNGKVVGINPLTGKILWEFARWDCVFPVPDALDAGDNKVLVTGGYQLGALML